MDKKIEKLFVAVKAFVVRDGKFLVSKCYENYNLMDQPRIAFKKYLEVNDQGLINNEQ